MKRRYLMVLLCVALLAALFAGCAASPSPTASPSASPSAEPSASPSPTESPAPEAVAPAAIPLATPVTLNIFAYVDQNTTNPDYNNMDFWKQVEQATGINLNFTCFQGSAADLATKLNLLMAGGQYPDIVLMDLNAAQNVETYGVQQGIYIPLDPYLNATSMPNYYGVLSQTAFGAGPLVCSDGHVYSFGKMVDNGIKQFGKLYMNTKLLEAKGITPPDPNTMTWDQFNQTLQAVAALNDPSITPLSCTYGDPYVGAELLCGLWGGQMCYAGATGNPSGYAIDDNGKIYDCAATDQYRAFLTWLNSAYTGGLIDKEFLTQDNNTYYAKLTAGTSAFVLMNRTLNMAYSYDGIDKDYTQVMLTNMGVNPGAAPVWYTSTGGVPMQQGVSITIADKYIPETLALLNYLCDPMVSMQSMMGLLNGSDGNHYMVQTSSGQYTYGTDSTGATWTGAEISQVVPGSGGTWSMMNGDQYQSLWQFLPGQTESVVSCNAYQPWWVKNPADVVPKGALGTDDMTTLVNDQADIAAYQAQMFAQFVTQGVTDASWSDYLNQLKTAHNEDQWLALTQQSYDNFMDLVSQAEAMNQ